MREMKADEVMKKCASQQTNFIYVAKSQQRLLPPFLVPLTGSREDTTLGSINSPSQVGRCSFEKQKMYTANATHMQKREAAVASGDPLNPAQKEVSMRVEVELLVQVQAAKTEIKSISAKRENKDVIEADIDAKKQDAQHHLRANDLLRYEPLIHQRVQSVERQPSRRVLPERVRVGHVFLSEALAPNQAPHYVAGEEVGGTDGDTGCEADKTGCNTPNAQDINS